MGLVGFILCYCRIDQKNFSFFYFVKKFSGNFTKSSPFPAVMDNICMTGKPTDLVHLCGILLISLNLK